MRHVDQESTLEAGTPTGDRNRISDAYEAHAGELRRYAGARLRDSSDAEDIVQESFLRLARESQIRQYPRQPGAWLHRVVLNLIISRARRAAIARRETARDQFSDLNPETPEMRFLASERRRILGSAMDMAGPDGRTGLILAAQGYSGREIAKVLGRSEAATRTLMCRARSNIRRELTTQDAAYVTA